MFTVVPLKKTKHYKNQEFEEKKDQISLGKYSWQKCKYGAGKGMLGSKPVVVLSNSPGEMLTQLRPDPSPNPHA